MRRWVTSAHGSPLYQHLGELIASDTELMRILNRIEHTPNTNVLFAGVQLLMMKGHGAELRHFYPNLSDNPLPIELVGSPFRAFVADHEDSLVEIGGTKYTQTNECRRCVALLPGIWLAPFERFHLIDVGCSAGLNLAIDRYQYRWDDVAWGRSSPVVLETAVRGRMPAVKDIEIISRTGLDLHPIDPADQDARMWLEALVWPEQQERRRRLVAALDEVGQVSIEFVTGDAVTTLDTVLEPLPEADPVVILNSFSLNQFESAMRSELDQIVANHRLRRPIHRVSLELFTSDNEWAHLQVDDGRGFRDLGHAHPHGDWIEFYA